MPRELPHVAGLGYAGVRGHEHGFTDRAKEAEVNVELYMDDESAGLYDLEHAASPSDEDFSFYLEQCKKAQGSILELACGTGRLLVPALEAGCKIDGLDLSVTMLAVLGDKLRERGLVTTLFQQDMTRFALEKKYDLIMVAVSSFLLLREREIQINCLECCHKHLKDGGTVVLDLMLERASSADGIFKILRRFRSGEKEILVSNATTRDPKSECEEVLYRYEIFSDDGQLVKTFLRVLPWRWVSPDDLTSMARQAGFTTVDIFGGYKLEPLSEDHQELVAVLAGG